MEHQAGETTATCWRLERVSMVDLGGRGEVGSRTEEATEHQAGRGIWAAPASSVLPRPHVILHHPSFLVGFIFFFLC